MLRGVFVPRPHATAKQPDSLTAWFGIDSSGLAACGVAPGTRLTGYKQASRLAATRFTARALDDRVGCTALLIALGQLDPARINHKVIFVWSVREEVGLEGAAVVARALVTSALEQAKETGIATAIDHALPIARVEVSRLQERVEVAKRAKDTEAAVNLGISTKRLLSALDEAERL